MFVFFKQKTAYEMRISDWSSDVCSSDLGQAGERRRTGRVRDDVDGETHPVGQILHIVHRQRHAVERYRALGRQIGRDLVAGDKGKTRRIAHGQNRIDLADAVDMTRDNVPAQLVADFQRPFELEAPALIPRSEWRRVGKEWGRKGRSRGSRLH